MKYPLLCRHEEKKLDSMSSSECAALLEETMASCEALAAGATFSSRPRISTRPSRSQQRFLWRARTPRGAPGDQNPRLAGSRKHDAHLGRDRS